MLRRASMKVIGTAGHIDHGKSTLVNRLTGIDPDRLEEEKRRGMTIDLGFAWVTLPSGREVSIVDVPGHERFIKNMLAGAAGIDIALLVVAADEGVMPQTREHLDILDLLDVHTGVVAVTKIDLVDAEWLELVRADVEEAIARTSLAGSPIVAVSARSGAGLEELLRALDGALAERAGDEHDGLPFLPIDRVFTVAGFGTVVTGTLHGGSLATGQEVEVAPEGLRARIRGIQSHRRRAERVEPGTRVALNLATISHDRVERGDVVALPRTINGSRRVAARLRVLPHLTGGMRNGLQVAMHVGASEVPAIVQVFGDRSIEPGATGWVELRLERPVAAVRGQRFVLRLPAPLGTVAGGELVDLRPRYRRMDPQAPIRLASLASGNLREALGAALADERPRTPAQVAQRLGITANRAQALLEQEQARGNVVNLDGTYISRRSWEDLSRRALESLQDFHDRSPLLAGMPREELRRRLGIGKAAGAAAISRLVSSGAVAAIGPVATLPGRSGGTEARGEEAERVLRALAEHPFSPPSGADLLARARTDTRFLEALAREGRIVCVADGLYLERSMYDRQVCDIVAAIETDGEITVAAVRDRYGTSRKYALALLEHLDDERITRRVGDRRILGSRRPVCAPV
jgi:selenocysteine-specific elongation factor